jgi:hypothetical protein
MIKSSVGTFSVADLLNISGLFFGLFKIAGCDLEIFQAPTLKVTVQPKLAQQNKSG